jgi:photosystem II stability/assembly factor-like uncharacterized protein
LRWNGSAWQPAATGTAATLHGVAFISADDGWAVSDGGLLLHWNGSVWSSMLSPTIIRLHAVAFVTPDAGWAVGASGIRLRWDGSPGRSMERPAPCPGRHLRRWCSP